MTNSRKLLLCLEAGVFVALLLPENTPATDFYAGKTIRVTVGLAAGGGYDAYTRMVARYISRYIPGNPSTTVENMDGAGSVIAANYMYNKAGKDGLTVAIWNSHNVFNHMMGDPSIRERSVEQIYSAPPDVKQRLEFLFKKRPTS